MPSFNKQDTKSYKKEILTNIELKTTANITVVGSLKNHLLRVVPNINEQSSFSFLIDGMYKSDIHLNVTCKINYQQHRSGFFKLKKVESHQETSNLSINNSSSSIALALYQQECVDKPESNLLIIMPATMEEHEQLCALYQLDEQYTHTIIIQPMTPDKEQHSFRYLMNSSKALNIATHVGNEQLNINMARHLKDELEKLIEEVREVQIKKLVQEKQNGFQQECEADLLAATRLESEDYFVAHRCC